MRVGVSVVLGLVAMLHALPLVGVLGPAWLSRLYGPCPDDPNVVLLLRHRAVLFGLLAAFLGYAAVHPALHGLALVAGVVSVGSFLLLAGDAGPLNAALAGVVRADRVALALLAAATVVHWKGRG